VKHAYSRVKAESGSRQPGFGFEESVKIVEHGIRRVDC
jgi:hypothetical protein